MAGRKWSCPIQEFKLKHFIHVVPHCDGYERGFYDALRPKAPSCVRVEDRDGVFRFQHFSVPYEHGHALLTNFCASSPYKLKVFFADSACLFLQSTLALHGPRLHDPIQGISVPLMANLSSPHSCWVLFSNHFLGRFIRYDNRRHYQLRCDLRPCQSKHNLRFILVSSALTA